jgi:xylulokinase
LSVVLACDLGGSSFRAALVDADGVIRQIVTERYTRVSDDPAEWWAMFCRAIEQLDQHTALAQVHAVAISAFTRTQIVLDASHHVLTPATLWDDSAAEPLLPELRATLARHPELPAINAFHPAARLFRLAREHPHVAHAAAAVLEPKDFLNLRLTGICAIDRIASARLIATGTTALQTFGYADIIPDPLEPTAIVGHVQPGLPGALARLEGRPVIAMAHDTWASVIGLGALREGCAYNLSGTTEVLGVMTPQAAPADGLLTVDWGGLHQIGGPSQVGGDTLVWLASLLGQGSVADLTAVLEAPRDLQPLLFLPYLRGERTPYWDPALRGAFIGLNRNHGPADFAHAVLEGVAFLNRLVLQRAEAASGAAVREIRLGGGGAANAVWCQVKADTCERPVVVVDSAETGLNGAAIVAFVALGRFADLAAGQSTVRARETYQPRPDRAPHYRRMFQLFREAEAAVAPLSHQLAAIGTA